MFQAVNWRWLQTSALFGILSVGLLIWVGPWWAVAAAGLGAAAALLSEALTLRDPARHPSTAFCLSALAVHGVLICVSVAMAALFLGSLSDHALQLPKFRQTYTDPGGVFLLAAPDGWDAVPLARSDGNGVTLSPRAQGSYMGVSEVQVFVRKLEKPPSSPDIFLKKMAASFSRRQPSKKLFTVQSEPVPLLSHGSGVISTLEVKRYWVPLKQVSLFAIKNDRYLCSVSATGLANHGTLARVLCLGLFEKITVIPQGR